jgi:hypothetical protein
MMARVMSLRITLVRKIDEETQMDKIDQDGKDNLMLGKVQRLMNGSTRCLQSALN